MSEERHVLLMSRETFELFYKENQGRKDDPFKTLVAFDDNLDFGTAVLTDGNQILWVGNVLKRK